MNANVCINAIAFISIISVAYTHLIWQSMCHYLFYHF